MKNEGQYGGPPRESADPNPDSLEYMEKQIDAERKHGLLIPEHTEQAIEKGEEMISFNQFAELLKKKIPQEIILYSAKTGLLRHLLTDKKGGEMLYTYQGDSYLLNIEHDKKNGWAHILDVKKIPKETRKPTKKKEAIFSNQLPYTQGEGPFRKLLDPKMEGLKNKIKSLEKMEKEIAAEGRLVGLPLDENITVGAHIPLFEAALNNDVKLKPEDIAFYSVATGILKYSRQKVQSSEVSSLYYTNPNNNNVELDIYLDKEDPLSATVFSITTKAKAEKDIKQNKEMQKRDFNSLMLRSESDVQDITQLIKEGLPPDNREETNEGRLAKLKTLRANVKYLDSVLEEKIKELEDKK